MLILYGTSSSCLDAIILPLHMIVLQSIENCYERRNKRVSPKNLDLV